MLIMNSRSLIFYSLIGIYAGGIPVGFHIKYIAMLNAKMLIMNSHKINLTVLRFIGKLCLMASGIFE